MTEPAEMLFEIVTAARAGPFEIQSWTADHPCTCGFDHPSASVHGWHRFCCPYLTTTRRWVPMTTGAGWRPRKTPQEAVAKAAAWSGAFCGLGIPAMQVVDQATGDVVWRSSDHYPASGPPIEPDWMPALYDQIREDMRREEDHETNHQLPDQEDQ